MVDFVCIGDAAQDNFFFINEASVHCNLKRDDCVLELKYGQKIPAEHIGMTLGGNAANVAVGLSRLALGTKLLTTFGDDERGAWIKRELLREGVNLDGCATLGGRVSNLSGILVFRGERTVLTYHPEGEDLAVKIPEAFWIYISSSAGRDSRAVFTGVIEYKKNHPATKIAFNPGTKDLKLGREHLAGVLQVADVLFLNWEEAETILQSQESKVKSQRLGNAREMLEELSETGPKIVAMTDGPEGAYAFNGKRYVYSQPADFNVLESTGAGDAFSSGFLAGLWHNNMEMVPAMKWAMVNSGSVVTRIGGQEGLLTAGEINKYLEEHPGFKPTQI